MLVRRAASVDSWSTRLESNQRKTVLQTAPLTVRARVRLGAGGGFEPPTAGLWGRRADHCSTLHVIVFYNIIVIKIFIMAGVVGDDPTFVVLETTVLPLN